MLLEREDALRRAQTTIDAARDGDGAVLWVEGPAGIGKTRLLGAVRRQAREHGVEVLHARGGELERAFSYGVVRQLFEPVLRSAGAVARAELLSGAARHSVGALGFDDAAAAAPGPDDAEAIALHGLYWLTAGVAGDGPLLLCVDDLHWADAASVRFLVYLARRLEGLGVAIVCGSRPPEAGADGDLLAQLAATEPAQRLTLAPLGLASTKRLVGEAFGVVPGDGFVVACHEAAGGNPFLLDQLLTTLREAGVPPEDASAGHVRRAGSATVSASVAMRLRRLPPAAGRLATAAATLGKDAALDEAAALAGLGDAEAAQAAGMLVAADLLAADRRLRFRHPMLRVAVLDGTPPPERAHRHREAARLLSAKGAPADRVAAQLHEAEPGGSAWAVAALREAAAAVLREAPHVAVAHLERALAEPPPEGQRAALLLELGDLELRLGRAVAVEHLSAAVAGAIDAAERVRAAILLARAHGRVHRAVEAVEVLDVALGRPEPDREQRLELEAERFAIGVHDLRTRTAALERLEALLPQITGATPGELLVLAWAENNRHRGEPQRAEDEAVLARRALEQRIALGGAIDPLAASAAAVGLALAGRVEEAERYADEALARATDRGSVVQYHTLTGMKGFCQLFRGALRECEAHARTALDAVRDQGDALPPVVCGVAQPLVMRGEPQAALALLAEHGLAGELPGAEYFAPVLLVRAGALAATGRPDEALADLREIGARMQRRGVLRPEPPWRSEAAVLLMHSDPREALRLAREELELALVWDTPRATGIARRALGVVIGGEEGLEHLRASVADLERSPARLDLAIALLELGAATRRAGRRIEARPILERAMDLAHLCGATVRAERAREELRTAGARPRRLARSGAASLTAAELRVAQLAAQGLTNRRIAEALFVTLRTVETHLRHAFQKLDVSSRDQLAGALQPPDAPQARTATSPDAASRASRSAS